MFGKKNVNLRLLLCSLKEREKSVTKALLTQMLAWARNIAQDSQI